MTYPIAEVVKSMRVISGSAKGRRLETPAGDQVRPTTDIVKEAFFSIVQFSIEGCRFLDTFAGSGQMGIEALSRGAERAVFLDISRKSLALVKNNIRICALEDKAELHCCDSVAYLSSASEKFDIVYLDPPYLTGLLEKALEKASCVLRPGGRVICEHPVEQKLPEKTEDLELKKQYRYGRIMLSIYRAMGVEKDENSDISGKL